MKKSSRKKGSLATRLTIAMTTLVITTITSVTLLSLKRQQETFRAELQQQAEILLNTLVVTTGNPLYFLDVSSLREFMKQLGEANVLVSGHIYDDDGRLIADAYRPNILAYEITPDPFGQKLLNSPQIKFIWYKDRLIAGRAVLLGNQTVGAVSVGLSTKPLHAKINAVRNQGIAAATTAALCGTVLSLLLSRSITEPLQQMTRATKQLAAGDLSQTITITSNDELEVLAESFNSMTSRLRELIARIQDRAEQLHQSESKNRALLDAIPDLILVFNQEGILLDCKCQTNENTPLSLPFKSIIGKKLMKFLLMIRLNYYFFISKKLSLVKLYKSVNMNNLLGMKNFIMKPELWSVVREKF